MFGQSLCKKDLGKLQRIQNRAMRIILGCHPRTHIVDMLDTLKWMSIKQRFRYNLSILLWKITNNRTPPTLGNFFTPVAEIHTYNTRSSSSGNFHRKRSHKHSLTAIGASTWNAIPQHVRDVSSLYSFKKNLILHIFQTVDPM